MKMKKRLWQKEKMKTSGVLKLFAPIFKQSIHAEMKLTWYRHIDKALRGETVRADARHWRKMLSKFRKDLVGVSTPETKQLLDWLVGFARRVQQERITVEDKEKWLPQFKDYMLCCEKNGIDNYIVQNKLLEA